MKWNSKRLLHTIFLAWIKLRWNSKQLQQFGWDKIGIKPETIRTFNKRNGTQNDYYIEQFGLDKIDMILVTITKIWLR
jgi:hypothetical protein